MEKWGIENVRSIDVMTSAFHPKWYVVGSSPRINLSKKNWGLRLLTLSPLSYLAKVGTLCIGYEYLLKSMGKEMIFVWPHMFGWRDREVEE